MVRSFRWFVAALLLAVPLVAPSAQQVSTTVGAGASVGPRISSTRAGITVQGTVAARGEVTAPAPQNPALRRRGVPQMIVGGAAIIGGALVGDDAGAIISIAGLGVGLWGLWLYLN